MATTFVFEMADRDTDDLFIRTFDVVGVAPGAFQRRVDEGPWFDWIEEVEQELGTIDQTGGDGEREGDFAWTLASSEIEDRDAFVERAVAKLREMFGWTLVERT